MGTFLRHEPCPNCGSKDNLARYADGSATCFGCKHYEKPSGSKGSGGSSSSTKEPPMTDLVAGGQYTDLPSRGLREATLRKLGYKLADVNGEPVQIAEYRSRKGEVVGQKIRKAGKKFAWRGAKGGTLFGQHAWGAGSRRVVVTEGEIDALTVAQVLDLKWPVVSVPDGATSLKAIEQNSDWLETFEEVVFMFDGDEPGRQGARECAALLSPGKAKIAHMPDGEDPNSLLQKGLTAQITSAIYEAKPYRPDGVATLSALLDEAVKPVEWGLTLPKCMSKVYEWSYGPKPGQVWVGGAGVGIGKTDIFTELEAHDLIEGRAIAVLHAEQPPPETPKRIAAKMAGKPFFLPDCEYTEEELRGVLDGLEDKLFIYDHRVLEVNWDEVKNWVRWVVKAYGVKVAYIDNLTLLTADAEDERRFLDFLMKDAKLLASQLGITIHFLSHLTTPSNGAGHEEGGKVEAKQFTGSRAIMRYADYMWGLERNTQHDDERVRGTSTFRVLKDRASGRSTGRTFYLYYDPLTTLQEECAAPPTEKEGSKYGFKEEEGYSFA
jgi:twinkle protein